MARLSDRYVLQMVENRAILTDDSTGAEESIALDPQVIGPMIHDYQAEHGLWVGSILLPPDTATWFCFYLGYFHMAHRIATTDDPQPVIGNTE